MNDTPNQADALDRFFDLIRSDPMADAPGDLDPATAQVARELVQALRVPPLESDRRARIWQAASGRLTPVARSRTNGHFPQTKDVAPMHTKTLERQPTVLARPGWSMRALLAAAALLIVILAGILLSVNSSGGLGGLLPGHHGHYGSGITPTPPVTPTPVPPPVPITVDNAHRLGEVARLGRGAMTQALWSPDGAALALVGMPGVWLYDTADFSREPAFFPVDNAGTVQYLANGDLVALRYDLEAGTALYQNVITGQTIMALPQLDDQQVIASAFSPDARYLAGSTLDGSVAVWDVASGAVVARLFINVNTPAMTLLFSSNGRWLAAGPGDYTARLWSAPDGDWAAVDGQAPLTLVSALRSEANVPGLAFDAAGGRLAVSIGDDLEVWDVAAQQVITTLQTDDLLQPQGRGGAGQITGVTFAADGQTLLTTGQITRLWDITTGAAVTLPNTQRMTQAALNPDGTRLAVGNDDGSISVLAVDPLAPPVIEPSANRESGVRPLFEDTLAMSSYPLVLREAVDSLPQGTIVRMLYFWYIDDTWWYLVMAQDEMSQALVREDQLVRAADMPALPTPTPAPTATPLPAGVLEPLPVPAVAEIDAPPLALAPLTAANVTQIGLIDMIGRGEVSTLAWSPDGSTLVASGYVGVWRYDAADLAAGPRLLAHAAPVSAVAYAPDGTLYALDFDYALLRWDTATDAWIVVTQMDASPYNARLALHPSGTLAAVGGGDGTIRLYGLPDGTPRGVFSTNPNTPIDHVAWSADGTTLGATGDDGAGRIWHDPAGNWQTLPAEPSVTVVASPAAQMTPQIAFSPDGATFVTVGGSGSVIWNTASGEQVGVLRADSVVGGSGIAYSPDGAQLVTASPDVRLWDTATGTYTTLDAPDSLTFGFLMNAVAFHPDGSRVAAVDNAGALGVWDTTTGALEMFVPAPGFVQDAAISATGQRIALLASNGNVALWDTAAGQMRATLSPDDYLTGPDDMSYNIAVALSPDGQYVAFGSRLDAVRLWDTAAGTVRLLAFTTDPNPDAAGGRALPPLLYAMAFSRDGGRLAAGGDDGVIAIWDTASGAPLQRLQAAGYQPGNSTIFSLDWSPDGTTLAAGNGDMGQPETADFGVRLWDTASGGEVAVLEGHTERVTQVQFSADGTRLLSACYGDLRVWSLPDGALMFSTTARTGAFTADGDVLAMDDTLGVRLFDPVTGGQRAALPGLPAESLLRASTDGRVVITQGRAGVVRVWGVPDAP